MKIIFTTFLICINCFIFAQNKEIYKVQKAVEKLTAAMISANKEELENITSNQLSYGHSSGRIEDKKTFIENIMLKKSVFKSIQIVDQTIEIFKNTAIVRHNFMATTNDNGIAGNVQLKILLVFIKQNKNWKLMARQSVKN